MKKIISLILCIILCFNLVCFTVLAEQNYKLKDEQVTLLTAIGMYNKEVQLSETVTRGQFAEMLVKSIFDEPEYLISGTERFNDVDENHQYYDSVMLLKNLKVTYGDGEGNFNPEEEISANDAIVMAVRFLGYTKLAEKTGYIPFAAQKGISKGMQYEYSDSLSMYNAYLLIYNVLTVDVADRYVDDTASFMRNYRTLHKVEGVVDDDGFINKNGLSEISSDEIVIDGVIYKNATNEKNLFGCSVIAFYKYDKDGEATILAIIQTNKNETLFIDSKNIEGYDPATRTYEYKESEFDDNAEKIQVPKGIKIVYNGVPLVFGDEEFTNDDFIPQTGSVTFFDSDGDGKYDYLYINSYETYVVSAVDAVQNIIYMKDFEKPIELKKDKYRIFNSGGDETELSNIGVGNTVSVMKSLTGEIHTIYVSNVTVSDIVTAKDDDGVISTQNNGVLKLSKSFITKQYNKSDKIYSEMTEALESLEFSVLYKFYIDVFGNVAYAEPEIANLWTVATITRAANNSRSPLAENYEVELFGFDGTLSKLKLAEKVVISDQNNFTDTYEDKIAVEILNTFAANEINRVIRYKLNMKGLITDVELPLVEGFEGLEDIDTDRLHIIREASNEEIQYFTTGKFDGYFLTADDCKVMNVDGTDVKNTEKYSVMSVADVFINQGYPNLIAYGTETKNMTASYMVNIIASDNMRYTKSSKVFLLVSGIVEEYDREKMQTLYRIDGYNGTTPVTIYADSISKIKNTDTIYDSKIKESDKHLIKKVDVSVGDLIIYSLDRTKNGKNIVNEIKVIYDSDGVLEDGKGFFDENKGTIAGATYDFLNNSMTVYGNPFAFKANSLGAWVNSIAWYVYPKADNRISMGFVYSEKDGNVVLTTQPLNKQKYKNSLNYANNSSNEYVTEAYTNVAKKIIKVKKLESGKVKVSAGTAADLKPYTVYGHDCSQVLYVGSVTLGYIYVLE